MITRCPAGPRLLMPPTLLLSKEDQIERDIRDEIKIAETIDKVHSDARARLRVVSNVGKTQDFVRTFLTGENSLMSCI